MAEEFMYELKIPQERVAVLIGASGKTKLDIEAATKTKITVDSKDGDVFISGEDALGLYTTKGIVKAIGRGFNPELAMNLLKADYVFEMIDIRDYSGKSKNSLERLKGRVIGKEGKSRELIEEMTEAYVCVYGKTVSIIGEAEQVSIAKQATESLLEGANHASVYKWLEKKRRELKKQQLLGKEAKIFK